MLAIKFVVSNGIESFVMARSPVLAGQVDEHSKSQETHPAPWLWRLSISRLAAGHAMVARGITSV